MANMMCFQGLKSVIAEVRCINNRNSRDKKLSSFHYRTESTDSKFYVNARQTLGKNILRYSMDKRQAEHRY